MTQPHPIIQKELDAFREHERNNGRAVYDNQFDFLLFALQRASLAVVEEIKKSVESIKDEYENEENAFNNGLQAMKGDVLDTLATAREIIVGK